MNLEIGKRISTLRAAKGNTQEVEANFHMNTAITKQTFLYYAYPQDQEYPLLYLKNILNSYSNLMVRLS